MHEFFLSNTSVQTIYLRYRNVSTARIDSAHQQCEAYRDVSVRAEFVSDPVVTIMISQLIF
jgi:hypothetical protein